MEELGRENGHFMIASIFPILFMNATKNEEGGFSMEGAHYGESILCRKFPWLHLFFFHNAYPRYLKSRRNLLYVLIT